MHVIEKINKMSIEKFACLLTIAIILFYLASEIVIVVLKNSSIFNIFIMEHEIDTDYRDKMVKKIYDSYSRKMSGSMKIK